MKKVIEIIDESEKSKMPYCGKFWEYTEMNTNSSTQVDDKYIIRNRFNKHISRSVNIKDNND